MHPPSPMTRSRAKIEDYMKQQKVNEQLGQYVAQLKKGAKIETFLN